MVGTIIPIVYGKQQQSKVAPALMVYTVACVLGAAALGLILGVLGTLLPRSADRGFFTLVIVGGVSLLYSSHELGFFRLPAPQLSWQVPSLWRAVFPANLAVLFYGFCLGLGVTTRIPTSTFYPVLIWALLIGHPLLATIGMAAFGLGRCLPPIYMAARRTNTEESFDFAVELASWQPAVHLMNGVLLGSAGSCLIVSGLVAL